MNFKTAVHSDEYVIWLEGRTAADDCQRITEIARQFIDSPCCELILDFEKLVILDSLGLSIILLVQNELEGKDNKKLLLRNPSGKVKAMFKNFNIDKVVDVQW